MVTWMPCSTSPAPPSCTSSGNIERAETWRVASPPGVHHVPLAPGLPGAGRVLSPWLHLQDLERTAQAQTLTHHHHTPPGGGSFLVPLG